MTHHSRRWSICTYWREEHVHWRLSTLIDGPSLCIFPFSVSACYLCLSSLVVWTVMPLALLAHSSMRLSSSVLHVDQFETVPSKSHSGPLRDNCCWCCSLHFPSLWTGLLLSRKRGVPGQHASLPLSSRWLMDVHSLVRLSSSFMVQVVPASNAANEITSPVLLRLSGGKL